MLVWEEFRPVFDYVETKGLNKIGVKGPISVELNYNEKMSQQKRVRHDWLVMLG